VQFTARMKIISHRHAHLGAGYAKAHVPCTLFLVFYIGFSILYVFICEGLPVAARSK